MFFPVLFGLVLVLTQNVCSGYRSKDAQIEEAMRHVLRNARPDIIPKQDDSPVLVHLSLSLTSIREVGNGNDQDEIEVTGYLAMNYVNPRLAWTYLVPEVEHVTVPASQIWLPDIEPYQAVTTPTSTLFKEAKALIYKSGSVTYVPAINIRFVCDVHQLGSEEGGNCTLKLGSWTHSGFDIDLEDRLGEIDVSGMFPNYRYAVLETWAERETKNYECCPEPYINMNYIMHLKLKALMEMGY